MRHIVGRNFRTGRGIFLKNIFPDQSIVQSVDYYLKMMENQAVSLEKRLHEISLTLYQTYEDPSRSTLGPKVRTTWMGANTGTMTLLDKCKWIAASLYREKLDQLLHGESHFSYVEYVKNGYTGGDVQAG